MKKPAITSLFCIISILGIIQIGYAQAEPELFPPKAKEIHTFNLQVFLEGPYNGSDMNIVLFDNGLLPLNQPYDTEPWNYFGGETLSVNPGDDVVDWVLVEFLESPYEAASATPDKIIHLEAALLMADGSIVQPNGISPLEFEADIQENLYIVVRHRNHLAVLSASSIIPTKGTYYYDFTNDSTKAYLDGQKEIATGVFGMAGGDCDANQIIENTDKDICWTVEAGNMGYLPGDWSLNTQINNPDKDDIWVENLGLESKVPRAFECGDILTDFRDDQTYNTVLIGDQCWMAENLNIGIRIDGTIDQSDNPTIEKYCYDDLESNCDTYGGLYQWDEMMQYITTPATYGICPDGWHIPTDNEWKYLEGTVDSLFGVGDPEWNNTSIRGYDAGLNLKSASSWAGSGNGTNESGFTTLPGGYRATNGDFNNLSFYGYLWSSKEGNSSNTWSRKLLYDTDKVDRSNDDKGYGFSARCLEYLGQPNLPPYQPTNPSPGNGSLISAYNVFLSWNCVDPDNDPITFDIYFGTVSNPPLLAEGVSNPVYYLGNLFFGTTYYWKIIAHDNHGNLTESDIWHFTTWIW